MIAAKLNSSLFRIVCYLLFGVFAFVSFQACTSNLQDVQKGLLGTWQVNSFDIQIKMWTATTLKNSKSLAETSTYVFRENGIFEIKNKHYPTVESEGKWNYGTQDASLVLEHKKTIRSFEDSREAFSVIQITSNRLILKKDYGEMGYVHYAMTRIQ